MKKLLLIFFLIGISRQVYAQQVQYLSGTIKDNKGNVLPGAGIYISGYKIATVSNNEGNYRLPLPSGNYDVLVQMIGFLPQNQNITIIDQAIKLDIILKESIISLNEVVVKPDPNREYYVNFFKTNFIGITPNAQQCKLLNPSVLNINYDEETGILFINCTDFLIIENKALGYKIKYLINNFQYNYKTKIVYFEGFPVYEDLEGNRTRKKKWSKARLIAYNGSSQHFFKSLYDETSEQEGFKIFKIHEEVNVNRPDEELIRQKIKQFVISKSSASTVNSDSLTYWIGKKNLPKTISYLDKKPVLTDTLVHHKSNYIKYIDYTDILYIIYTKEKEGLAYQNSFQTKSINTADDSSNQSSMVYLLIRPIYFYALGNIYNPKSILFEGYWAWEKIADSVPMDYKPVINAN
nr:carboxypeptidase-like regulatory domain-containing protein [Pseudopedobacter sp.]